MAGTLTQQTALTSEGAQAVLESITRERHIPGAAFAVVRGGEIVATAATGSANLNTGLPVTPDTLFQAGSIGKVYTATLIMQLVDEGLIELDKPVRTYLPELKFADPAATKSVTVRQLLTHTSGLHGDKLDETGSQFGRGDDCLERYVASLGDLPQIVPPGRLWSYCNSGYMVLGRVIEVLTGLTYEQGLKERLIQPLGLSKTVLFAEEAILHSVAVGHIPNPEGGLKLAPIWAHGRCGAPAGASMVTSVHDLLAFAHMHLRGGVARDGTRILSEASVREMQVPHVGCTERQLLGDHWGLGWMMKTDFGPKVIGHDGNTYGQTASLRLLPEQDIAYALLTNKQRGTTAFYQGHAAFTELCQQLIDPSAGTITPKKPRPVDGLELDLKRFVGTYERVGVRHPVTVADGKLMFALEVTEQRSVEPIDPRPRELQPIDESTFLLHVDEVGEDMQIYFLEPDAAGRPQYLHFGARISRRAY
jgi:CubicO group peptidase (beta-lactamase class C family)